MCMHTYMYIRIGEVTSTHCGWDTHCFDEVAKFNSDSEEPGRAI